MLRIINVKLIKLNNSYWRIFTYFQYGLVGTFLTLVLAMCIFFISFNFIWDVEKKRDKQKGRKRASSHLLVHFQMARKGRPEGRWLGVNPHFLHGWQELRDLSLYHWLPWSQKPGVWAGVLSWVKTHLYVMKACLLMDCLLPGCVY